MCAGSQTVAIARSIDVCAGSQTVAIARSIDVCAGSQTVAIARSIDAGHCSNDAMTVMCVLAVRSVTRRQ